MRQSSKKTKNSENIDMPTQKNNATKSELLKPKITIFGVGGAGGNAINNMIRSNLEGVEFVAANTDAQALSNSLASNLIQLGINTTKGLGAGSFPDRGRAAAEENVEEIERYIEGSNMVFIAAGMGGGTGTGAAPVIAKLARERDMLTVGVVTKPFHFEGKYRMETAESGIEELKKYVDTLIIIPNQNLFRIANENTTFESAFKMADDVLHAGVRGVTDLITMPGLVNLDFADIRTIMTKMGKAMMGTGEAEGPNRAIAACEAAISNPLLDDISIKGAKGVLVNMTGGPDMTLFEADLAVNTIRKEVDSNANIIFGSAFNENMKGKIRISVVATGIDVDDYKKNIESNPEIKEPSRFSLTSLEPKLSNKTFFDTGSIIDPEKNKAVEISENDLKPKQEFLDQPNLKYGTQTDSEEKEFTNKNSQKTFQNESQNFNQEIEENLDEAISEESEENQSFFDDEVESNDNIKIDFNVAEKSKKPVKKSKKESSGGFSLFSFMNNSKNKDDFESEAEDEIEIKTIAKAQPNNFLSKEKASQAAKKHQEFFGEEDNQEEDFLSEKNDKIEDDILNVPAFFRRRVNK